MRLTHFLAEELNNENEIHDFLTDTLGIDSEDFVVNSDKTVTLNNDLTVDQVYGQSLKRLPVKFKAIHGDIWINNCSLETLIGLPAEISGSLIITNSRIKNLRFAPKKVGEKADVILQSNRNLISLEGCPQEVENFDISDNHHLKSLVGGPVKVNRNYKVDTCNGLESIEGIANHIGKNLSMCNNRSLSSLKGIHKLVAYCGGKIDVSGNHFESHLLGLLLVKGTTGLSYKFGGKATKVFDIIEKCRADGKDEFDAQTEIMDIPELYPFAKL